MKGRRIALVGIAAALAGSFVLAGCSQNKLTVQDIIDRGYVHCVTFDLMGGKSGERTVLEQYVRDNSLVLEPGATSKSDKEPVREGYTFNAFYTGSKDENGVVEYGREWDFEKDRVTEDITLYAYWNSNYSITVHYGEEGEGFTKTASVSVPQSSSGEAGAVTSVRVPNSTILALYETEADALAGTNPITISASQPYVPEGLNEDNTTAHLWAVVLKGTWRLVYDADDLSINTSTNIYLMVDELDMGGKKLTIPDRYTGTFEGNGAVIKNFTVDQPMEQGTGEFSYGLFRTLTSTAVIQNVTFENVTYRGEVTNPIATNMAVGVLAGTAQEGAKVKNVSISGTFTYYFADKYFDTMFPDGEAALIGNREQGVEAECDISGVTLVKKHQSELNDDEASS